MIGLNKEFIIVALREIELTLPADHVRTHLEIARQIEILDAVVVPSTLLNDGGWWLQVATGWINSRTSSKGSFIGTVTRYDIELLVAKVAAAAINEFKG